MTQIYHIPIPDADADRLESRYSANVEQSGVLEGDGSFVENVATESNTIEQSGRFEFGRILSEKLATELDSLAESNYRALPVFVDGDGESEDVGYFEIQSADVSEVHPVTNTVYTYTIELVPKGTREDSRRAVMINPEDVSTGLSTGGPAPIAAPSEATEVRWFDDAEGSVEATPSDTVTTEYGDLDRYAYGDAPFDTPTLIYDVPLSKDGPTDVRVYDDNDREKFSTLSDGTQVNTWVHAYNTGFDFNGGAVIDNGLTRVYLDDTPSVSAEEYDETSDSWSDIELDSGDLSLKEWSIMRISPTRTRVRLVAKDEVEGDLRNAYLNMNRGVSGVILRQPRNESLSTKFESWFSPVASDVSEDPQPEKDLKDRGET